MSVKSRVPYLYSVSQTGSYIIKISVRDGQLENLWGGDTPINTKKIFMLWPKQNSYKQFDNEENSYG